MVTSHFSPTRDGPERVTASDLKVTFGSSAAATLTLADIMTPVASPLVTVLKVNGVAAFTKVTTASDEETVAAAAVAITVELAIRVAMSERSSPD